jgi:hypothetical protein
MRYSRPITLRDDLKEIRNNSILQGVHIGFNAVSDLFTLKKGYPFFIAGLPYSGKSRFAFEMLINTSQYYNWKHFIYSPETGNAEDVVILLMQMYTKKQFRKFYAQGKESKFAMSDTEFDMALHWVNTHFTILDLDKEEQDISLEGFYQNVQAVEQELDIRFDTTVIDPFIDISFNLSEYGGREDLYLKKALTVVRRDAKNNNRINFIIHHVGASQKRMMQDGKQYEPIPHPNQWAGGQMWYRKAYTMMTVYRPDREYYSDKVDFEIKDNESWIIINKAKPDGIGRTGQARLFYDHNTSRYYEVDYRGNICFAERPESADLYSNQKELGL